MQEESVMKCPKCGAHSTIIENDGHFDSHDDFYYCYGYPNPLAKLGGKIIQQGTQDGCSHTFPFSQLGKFDTLKIKVPKIGPLDPWGAPVDTRGYPSH